MYFLYNVLLGLGFAVLLPKFLIDAWRHGKYVTGLRQRLGFIKRLDNHDGPILWLHCVSVGETQAALPLLRAIRKEFPHYRIVASTTTVTGQELAREIFKDVVEQVFFFPIDWSWTVKRTLRAIKPAAVVLLETELWPVFLRECQRRCIPAVIVNGRISEKSFARYQLVRRFVAKVVNCLDLAIMQTEADANRMRSLGLEESRVLVSGNMKFDAGTTGEQDSLPAQLASRFGLAKTDTILAASTHDPEERLILEVFRRLLKQYSELRLIIAPRHPERFAEVASLLNSSSIPWRSRTATPTPDDEGCRIILLDTIGELRRVLPLSRIVFVGGSIAAVGGHNVLEPAAVAAAIVTGPHTANFQEIVTTFLQAQALIQLADLPESEIVSQLTEALAQLLGNREEQTAMGERARKLVEENRGATVRTVKELASTLRNPALSEEASTKQLASQGLAINMKAWRAIMFAPLSALYGVATATRLQLYQHGLLSVSELAAHVISVGNLTTGGTGKTPLVEFLARSLARQNARVCVLTRGYRRENPNRQILVSDGERVLAGVGAAGDEPMLLARNLLGSAAVICNADRYDAGVWASGNLGCDTFVLDDGFQHMQLARHFNILVVDATQPWETAHLLPWGNLRESRKAASRADCVVITRADQDATGSDLHKEIKRLAPDTPVFTSRMTVSGFQNLKAYSKENDLSPVAVTEVPKRLAAFCGIANPTSFFKLLEEVNCQPAQTTVFPDHHRYTKSDVSRIVAEAKSAGLEALVTTAKDAVKLQSLSVELPCYVMEIEVSLDDEARFLELLLAALPEKLIKE